MMDRADKIRLQKIVEYCNILCQITIESGVEPEQLRTDQILMFTVTTPLIQIGEMAKNLSQDLKLRYHKIAWPKISGLRNRLVHDYDNTNWQIVADTIYHNIVPLRQYCSEILAEDSAAENLS